MRHLCSAVLFTLALAAAAPAFAAPPEGKGPQTKERADTNGKDKDGKNGDVRGELNFTGADRRIVSDYYGPIERGGNCPPGLAKKNNGCRPPGQAKPWSKGQPLPPGITWYPLPGELSVRLPAPPVNHEYVRVGADILMVTMGTMMVVDAITDLGRR